MPPPRSSARFLPLFLALLVASAAPSMCRAAADGKTDDIKASDVPNSPAVLEQFKNLKAQYASDPDMAHVVDRTETIFDRKIVDPQNPKSYHPDEVQFIGKVITHIIEYGSDAKDIYANEKLDADQKKAELEKAKNKYNVVVQAEAKIANISAATSKTFAMPQKTAVSDMADPKSKAGDAPGPSGKSSPDASSGKSGVSGSTEDSAKTTTMGHIAAESVQEALSSLPHPPPSTAGGNAGLPTIGDIFGLPTDDSSPSSLMTHAGDELLKGDLDGGLASVSRAIDRGAGADAFAMRGGIELDQRNFSGAGQDAQHALQIDPANKQALTVAHFAEGRIDGGGVSGGPAGAAVKSAAAAPSGSGAFHVESFGGTGESGGGSSGAQAAGSLSQSGSQGAALSRMSVEQARSAAQSAVGMGDFGRAMAFVNRALAQDPQNPALLNLRSTVYARQHDYAKASADAHQGLLLAPKDPALLRSLGFAQLREKDYQGALATANEMLELNPNDPYAYAVRGHAYGSLGDRDAMLADLQRAAELDPLFAPAAAKMANQVQLPSDKDMLFLFPGEDGPAKPAAPAARARNFGLLVGASLLGGLLLALGLLHTVLAPLKTHLTSAFTRITRSGPSVGAVAENDTEQPASVNGLMPGLIRGQYELSRQIGLGGMGMVFAGTDRSLGRPVAIKKMRDEVRVNPQERERFVIEAKTVAALHHPNIVDIYSIAEDGADIYLIFEYVDGKTVHEIVRQAGRLSIADTARVVRGAADALGYAHSRGVIHRDMKPSNMMIDVRGSVKVMDFGVARMAKDAMTRYSMTNSVVGTPPYMAPEQEQGQVRRESDVYSLAVCAYEMLTGKLPFIGIGAGMLMNKINMSYVAPSRAIAGLPGALDAVFAKAFQADPDQRYRTPKEFADALESALPSVVRA